MFFKFKLSNNKLSVSDFETRNEVMKIRSSGNYNIISKDLNADNKISLKTKKFRHYQFLSFSEWKFREL